MKNKLSVLGALIAIGCAVVSVTGCISTSANESAQSHEHWGGYGEVLIPVKDFEPVGLVFTEVQFQANSKGKIEGQIFTYQALLQEAQKIGAHAIVNVSIDRMIQSNTSESDFYSNSTREETWYGSALAIKYTGAIAQANIASPSRQYQLNGGVSASSAQPPAGQSGVRTGF